MAAAKLEDAHGDENNSESLEEQKELEHFKRIMDAFRYYRISSFRKIDEGEKHFYDLPKRHQALLPKFADHLSKVKACVEQNQNVIGHILRNSNKMFENSTIQPNADIADESFAKIPRPFDMEKVRTTLRQLVRDWSDVGKSEREACYDPVIQEIQQLFPESLCVPKSVHVLVPGAGLGRLAYEIAKLGYTCQGNEWSLFMLIASNFVLNLCDQANQFVIHPWVDDVCNNLSAAHQIAPAPFPDHSPCDLPPGSNFSMAAGDFLEVYTEEETWDCIATVFFVDTAHNILAYIEKIWKILRPGGYWINLGPLLFHFADMPNENSLEISYEEFREAMHHTGFEIGKELTNVRCPYNENPNSMLKNQYDCVYFVAKKPAPSTNV